jgi:hypothetical protein
MANQWFYAKDGQKYGPVSGKRLKELALIGVVRRNDLLWSPGYSVWRPAKKFRGLMPKMDATSFNPAMSLFWRPGQTEQSENQYKDLLLEPNTPATAVTPPLPRGTNGKQATATASAAPRGTATPTARTVVKRQSVAVHPEAARVSAPSRSAAQGPQASRQPVAALAETKVSGRGFNLKGTVAIGGGIAVLSLIYLVVLLQIL